MKKLLLILVLIPALCSATYLDGSCGAVIFIDWRFYKNE